MTDDVLDFARGRLQIVQAHSGTLGVTSSAPDGTRFVARLPLAAVDDAPGLGGA